MCWRREWSEVDEAQCCQIFAALQGSCDCWWIFFSISVSKWVIITCYFIILKTLWNFRPVLAIWVKHHWGCSEQHWVKSFFLWCLCILMVIYFQLQPLSLFPCAGVGFFLNLARYGDFSFVYFRGLEQQRSSSFGIWWLLIWAHTSYGPIWVLLPTNAVLEMC